MGRVIVAGSIITDMSVKVKTHPKVGETVIGENVKYSPGGKGANQAVSAARLGAEVVMIGCIGDDAFGLESRDFIENQGIRGYIATCYGMKTGIAMIQVSEETGNNSIVVIPGANLNLKSEFIHIAITDMGELKKGDVLVSQFEIPLDTIKAFFAKGRENKTINILNPAPAQLIPDDIFELVDVLIVNETELEIVSQQQCKTYDEMLAAVRSIKRKNQIIIVTLGENGCMGYINNIVVKLPSVKVDVIDTTGAGDCFVGAIAKVISTYKLRIDGIMPNSDVLFDALDFATKAASLSVTKEGSGVSMPYSREINS